jgi:hypothetical protein
MEFLMSRSISKLSAIVVLLFLAVLFAGATELKWKPMQFDNPGTRRLLKTSAGNYYFYRSLPESSIYLNVKDLSSVEIRSFSKVKVKRPQLTIRYKDSRETYDLRFFALYDAGDKFYDIYEPLKLTIPPGVEKLELICYDMNIYFRAFRPVQVKIKPVKIPSLQILNSGKTYELQSDSHKRAYYSFRDSEYLSFQVNKGKPFTLYVRAQLTSRQLPVCGLYEDGTLVQEVKLSNKRSVSYKAEGLINLTIGKRLDFKARDKVTKYELRPLTDNIFIARPVIRLTK